jgi:uncharacterized protein (DUF927 family)
MPHKGIEAVREIIDHAEEFDPVSGSIAAMSDGQEGSLATDDPTQAIDGSEQRSRYLSFGEFNMNSDGLSACLPVGVGKKQTIRQVRLSAPFEILRRVRNPHGVGWARQLRWRDDDRRAHTFAVPDCDLHGDVSSLCANLASQGLKIATGRVREHFIRYLNEAVVPNRLTIVERTGWHDIAGAKVFVLPDQTIGSVPNEAVTVQKAMNAPFECVGTLADWQAGVGRLVTDHSRAVFAVSVGFAGPLLGLLGQEGGGFNLYGQSSRGKTTLLEAASSVWGKGASPGFVRSWRSTANALEAAAAIHTDTLLALDELGVVDPREAKSAAYQLAVGTGKGRSARDGSLRQPLSWRTMVLSTGEVRITDKLAEGGHTARAGQQVRLLDIPADAGNGFGAFDHGGAHNDAKVLADTIKSAARTCYGTAGPEFVRRLIDNGDAGNPDQINSSINAFRQRFAPKGADGQVLRACDRFGLVAAAGELAREYGIAPWKEGEALEAAGRSFEDWFDGRGGVEAGEVQAAISQVRLFIEQHGDSRFEPLNSTDRHASNRAGWRRGDGAECRPCMADPTGDLEVPSDSRS